MRGTGAAAEDFDCGAEIAALREGDAGVGAVASFIGTVRDVNDGSGRRHDDARALPGHDREVAARRSARRHASRWDLLDTLVIHRFGELRPTDQIVLVAVTSAHRGEASRACEFIMDYLKTEAPFWKKEARRRASAGSRRGRRTTRPRRAGASRDTGS